MSMPLPIVAGVAPSSQTLPAGQWKTILDFLIEHYPRVSRETWTSRMLKGEVVDETAARLQPTSAYRIGARVFYYRELEQETRIPFAEVIIYQDQDLLVVDKPHFLPIVPSGRYLQETLLVRLRNQGQVDSLVPIHRLDRETAGIVLFSLNPKTRGHYTSLFRERKVLKVYEALTAVTSGDSRDFPITRRSRLVPGEPFFRMREMPGKANSETLINLVAHESGIARYELRAQTGKKHQLRVHLAALGIPILNDRLYPDEVFVEHSDREDDFSKPLQLLARSIEFRDPLSGRDCFFESKRTLTAM